MLAAELREDRLPRTALLVVEVADSSVQRDRIKSALYAGAKIPEFWLVNGVDRTVEVFTDLEDRRYRSVRGHTPGDTLTCASLPKLRLAVSALFPKKH